MTGVVPAALDIEVDVPIIEVPVPRQQSEARAAMTIVDALLTADVSRREMLVVARSLEPYEQALTTAALRRELAPTYWTQIHLTYTQLYKLLDRTCTLLATDRIDAQQIGRVLSAGWTPSDADDSWPLESDRVIDIVDQLPVAQASIAGWQARMDTVNDHVDALIEWLSGCHIPDPATVENCLGGLIDRYRELVLPTVVRRDTPARLQTERATRATVRLDTLVQRLIKKYVEALDDGRRSQSWTTVEGLLTSMATQRPGRREHANARAIDLVESNDVWQRDVSYVIAVGLVEDYWPSPTPSIIPPAVRQAITEGDKGAGQVVPRYSWTAGREADQFIDTVTAARNAVVLIRHTNSADGSVVQPSTLLEAVHTTTLDQDVSAQLLTDGQFPKQLADKIALEGAHGQ